MIFAGCDLGISSAKAAIVDEEGRVLALEMLPYRNLPRQAAVAVMDAAMARAGVTEGHLARCLSTGFGKKAVHIADATAHSEFCLQRALWDIDPAIRTVIDVGGHTVNAFNIDPRGRISETAIIDKCVAGTGKFVEIMAKALELPLDVDPALLDGRDPVPMTNQCVILAESEVISLVNDGYDRLDIYAGMAASVASRIVGLSKRVAKIEKVAIVGGVAKNVAVRREVESKLGVELASLGGIDPQVVGALGAALLAKDEAEQGQR